MTASSPEYHAPRFCGHCGAALPSNNPRFCIECGKPITYHEPVDQTPLDEPASSGTYEATGITVHLPNARGAQSVVGGTVKLPTAGAAPPGLWFLEELPGLDDTIAIYAPLRAIVGGWSATTSDGWHKRSQAWAQDGTSRSLVRFEVEREWFAAPGAAKNNRLRVRIGAASYADEGRTRRGFRYRIAADPPMEVLEACWIDGNRRAHRDIPVPQIQIMAPPRIRRISDYDEPIQLMHVREAEIWAAEGVVRGVYRLPNAIQQRTLVGRGIPLLEVPGGALFSRLTGTLYQLHRVRMMNPLICKPGAWQMLLTRITTEARGLGLDMEADSMIEWWLDRQGYDAAIFERGAHSYGGGRAVIAFRRSQIVAIQS